jgi:ADP-ribosyl-[dinitrogen reductase] hydrolase
MNKVDNFLGCLVGLAVGDALGTTLEFTTYKQAQENLVTDIVGGGPFNLPPGCWTDDTSMALCIADSLIEKKNFDAIDIMKKFSKWYREGYNSPTGKCFDIGMATVSAIRYFEREGSFIKDNTAAGNGVIMRLAPIPMMFVNDDIKCHDYCKINANMTHPSPQGIGCSVYMGWIISSLLSGMSKNDVLEGPDPNKWAYFHTDPEITHPLVVEIREGKYKYKQPGVSGGVVGSGYVISCLETALWAFHKTDNFRDGALLAVNIGNDADTTGAVYGQIAGAYYGLSGIPKEWVDKIFKIDEIKLIAEQIFELSKTIKKQ